MNLNFKSPHKLALLSSHSLDVETEAQNEITWLQTVEELQ